MTVLRVKFGKRFRKDVKRLEKSRIDLSPLWEVVECLEKGQRLPDVYRDHPLQGKMQGSRECHIGPDWLLRYAKEEKYLLLLLISTGDHRHVLKIE